MDTTLLVLNIFVIVIWIPLLIVLIVKPQEFYMKNWVVALIIFNIIVIKTIEIAEMFK